MFDVSIKSFNDGMIQFALGAGVGVVGGEIIDAIVDIAETALYFAPEAQKSIRGNSTDKKIKQNYSNKMSYVY